MTAETEHSLEPVRRRSFDGAIQRGRVRLRRPLRALGKVLFSSVTRRILILNMLGLVALCSAILYSNQFRQGLIEARQQSLLTEARIISAAIAASATVDMGVITIDPDELLELETGQSLSLRNDAQALQFPINPEKVAPVLRRLTSPTRTRARIYDGDGILILDSRHLYSRGQILQYPLPPLDAKPPGVLERLREGLERWFWRRDLPAYRELGAANGLGYEEVGTALRGSAMTTARVNDLNEVVVSVGVPIQRARPIVGALMLSTEGANIEDTLRGERLNVIRAFAVAATIMVILSILLASTIAGPLGRISEAAMRVRRSPKAKAQIPEFSDRSDEIGHLSRSMREMTDALYKRMEAIERFAADVAHELKNPLTSLRSAVETLPRVKRPEDRDRLIEIVQHDVRRLDRLISDISDASRLDAELARSEADIVDMADLVEAVVRVTNEVAHDDDPQIVFSVDKERQTDLFFVSGHETRLGQVISNLIDNARSFSPRGGEVQVGLASSQGSVILTVDDDGPGIDPANTDRIFERFYTDRPDGEAFGQNSGLGLSISKQIVTAYGGSIVATNRPLGKNERVWTGDRFGAGARLVVKLPAAR
ncbi:MAG: sensor histidine kinase [Pseudomonadota bacterium]